MIASVIVGLQEPGAVRIGAPDSAVIERAQLTLRVERAAVKGTLTLELRNRRPRWTEANLTLSLPRGARVTGMVMTSGGVRAAASALPDGDAHVQYRATVDRAADPALVELLDETRAHEQLAIHVYPVAARTPATIELAIELPAAESIAIEPVGHAIAHLDIELGGRRQHFDHVDEARTIALPVPDDSDTPPAPFAVDAHHALLAEPPLPLPMPMFDLPIVEPRVTDSLSPKEIRTQVKLAEPRIARDVERWRFRATQSAVEANYPLEFRLPG